jgi:hypothetical protein
MGGVDGDRAGGPLVAPGQGRVGAGAQPVQADEVGVRIEHNHPQVGFHQQLLQDDPERVGLPRTGLAAQEGMPAEAPGVGQAGHAARQGQLAQPQPGAVRRGALLPVLHLRLGGDPDQRVMERGQVSVDDDAFAARVPDLDLGPGSRSVPGGRERQFRPRLPVEFEDEDLAEARDAAAVLNHGIAADLQVQGVQRRLEGECPPVDRRGEREDRRLHIPAHLTEGAQLPVDARVGVHV